MKIKNNIVPVFLMVLTLIGCTQEDLIGPINDMPQGMKTVTVDFQLPDDKPAFHEEGQSRAATGWETGDELMMGVGVVDAANNQALTFLTLVYDGETWDVIEGNSYSVTKLGSDINVKPYADQRLLTATENLSLTSLTLMLDENFGEVDAYYMDVYYGPDVERVVDNEGNDSFQLKANATTTAPEAWYAAANSNTASFNLQWSTNNQARLRIYTGEEGDVVTLTSAVFSPNVDMPADYTYTATTDKDGNAYFYGTMAEKTSNFKLELTAISGNALATPVTLLEASALVPVKLEAGEAYCLDASAKRNNVSQQ